MTCTSHLGIRCRSGCSRRSNSDPRIREALGSVHHGARFGWRAKHQAPVFRCARLRKAERPESCLGWAASVTHLASPGSDRTSAPRHATVQQQMVGTGSPVRGRRNSTATPGIRAAIPGDPIGSRFPTDDPGERSQRNRSLHEKIIMVLSYVHARRSGQREIDLDQGFAPLGDYRGFSLGALRCSVG